MMASLPLYLYNSYPTKLVASYLTFMSWLIYLIGLGNRNLMHIFLRRISNLQKEINFTG